MYTELFSEHCRDRARRQREHIARDRLQARLRRERRARDHRTLRARTARWLFAAAFALDARESWRAVWARMNAGGRP